MIEDKSTATALEDWLNEDDGAPSTATANEIDLKIAALKSAVAIVLQHGCPGENSIEDARTAVNRLTRSFLKTLGATAK